MGSLLLSSCRRRCMIMPFHRVHYAERQQQLIQIVRPCRASQAPSLPCHYRFLSTAATESSDTTNYRSEIIALAAAGQPAQAHALLKQWEQAGTPTPAAYAACLDAWATCATVLAAERSNEILNDMHARGTKANNKLLLPTSIQYCAVILAWSKVPHIKGAPQRAQRVLEEMEARFMSAESSARPTVVHYNLLLDMWGQSTEHSRATFATHLLRKMINGPPKLALQPTDETYRIMISVWCNSDQKRASSSAKSYLLTMTTMLTKEGRFDMEPTLADYQMVFQALASTKGKGAADHAFELLTHMQFLFVNRYTQVRPDLNCYRCILQTLAGSTIHNLGPKVDVVFKSMAERHIPPDTDCYAAAIETWSSDAIHKKCPDSFKSASRTHEMLQEMSRAHHRSTQSNIVVQTHHYNHVLRAWSATSRPFLPLQNANALLAGMESSTDAPPNSETYAAVLLAYSKSKSKDTLDPAIQIFDQAKKRLGATMESATYNSFICACASQKDPNIMMRAFTLAIQTFRDARIADACDAETFHIMLSAVNNLIPVGDTRNRALETVFEEGCKLGLLNREILKFFRHISTDDVYTKMVVAAALEEPQLGGKRLPAAWSSRSGVPLINTPIGQVVRPITADGDFLWTIPLMDHRMRHLKQHTGRRLLRGGRLDLNEQLTELDQ